MTYLTQFFLPFDAIFPKISGHTAWALFRAEDLATLLLVLYSLV